LQVTHRLEGNVGRGLGAAEQQAGVLLREIAFRRFDVEQGGEADGGEENQHRQRPPFQHDVERAGIKAHHVPEQIFHHAIEPRRILARRRAHEVGANHGGYGQ
jgi:hypothetical protein